MQSHLLHINIEGKYCNAHFQEFQISSKKNNYYFDLVCRP